MTVCFRLPFCPRETPFNLQELSLCTWLHLESFYDLRFPPTRRLDLSPPDVRIYAEPWPLRSPKDRTLWPSTK
ncbi:hypothetical protein CHARACLAT_019886 [Characodon lateralis]|uniref:Uncharacterized protein n=1 Tax=Characodon lateralis TaxID=208331 RepID=A0ABU7E3Z6_9TELE|nr:hypothetical protein [Characodon lateralis]